MWPKCGFWQVLLMYIILWSQQWASSGSSHMHYQRVIAGGTGAHHSRMVPPGLGSGHWHASLTCSTTGSRQWALVRITHVQYHRVTAVGIGMCHSLHYHGVTTVLPLKLHHQQQKYCAWTLWDTSSKATGILALPEIRVSKGCLSPHFKDKISIVSKC